MSTQPSLCSPAANTGGAFNPYAADLSASPPLVVRLTDNTDPNMGDCLSVWSLDDTHIAFTHRANSDVYLLTLITAAVVCIDTPGENEDYPVW